MEGGRKRDIAEEAGITKDKNGTNLCWMEGLTYQQRHKGRVRREEMCGIMGVLRTQETVRKPASTFRMLEGACCFCHLTFTPTF